jgi:hypothetical protein
MRWQDVEEQVRRIAEMHWNAICRPEDIGGVRFDAIIRVSPEEVVAIEITKENNLNKLRGDINKLSGLRIQNFQNNIFTRCYFITEHDASSLKQFGNSQNVNVLSANDFAQMFLGTRDYNFHRPRRDFGSSVDPTTGLPDSAKYTPIHYIRESDETKLNSSEISELVRQGRKIVLLGEFGSGKSRCIREIFEHLKNYSEITPTLAINLRENWGLSTFDLIVRNHFGALGLSNFADDMVKLVGQGRVRLLLDGFDEIGSQSWTGEALRLREIRRKSLLGVKDLITKCQNAGLLIAGREHYFSSDDELIDCLGLDDKIDVIRCPEEFTELEMLDYIKNNTDIESVPDWMPKKPLICQLFTKIEKDELDKIVKGKHGEVDFFDKFLDALAKREQRIHGSIDPSVLRNVLLNLAVRTRRSNSMEELSPADINEAFFEISGHTPLDESAVMLQRLPYLGRVGSGNPNRKFIDDYAKSGLRGLALVDALYKSDKGTLTQRWHKSLGDFGSRVVAGRVSNWSEARKFARLCATHGNEQVMCDLVCSELSTQISECDFTGLTVENSVASTWDFSNKSVKGLTAINCIVDMVELEDSEFKSCSFKESEFTKVSGVASRDAMPEAFDKSCKFGKFTDIDASSRVSALPISDKHKTLIMIIQKLFFQRGRGRKEEALLRGSSVFWDKDAAYIAINYMKKNGIVFEWPGKSGKLYIPELTYRPRMRKIKDSLSTSKDELWEILGR